MKLMSISRRARSFVTGLWSWALVGCAETAPQMEAQPPGEAALPSASAPSSVAPTAAPTPAEPIQQPNVQQPNVVGQSVTYDVSGKTFVSYLAYDSATTTRRPGMLVVPEWWGQNEYAQSRARQLAAKGYVALSVDMYGEGKITTDPSEAKVLSGAVYGDLDQAQARFVAAMETLKAHQYTAPADVSAVGYCFGGGISLSMARRGVDLDGVASFHGNLATDKPAQSGVVKAKVLVLTGEADPMVPPAQVEAFKKEMAAAGVNTQIFSYPGALHAFTNPAATELGKKFNMPVAYDANADAQSWNELMKFLSELYPSE